MPTTYLNEKNPKTTTDKRTISQTTLIICHVWLTYIGGSVATEARDGVHQELGHLLAHAHAREHLLYGSTVAVEHVRA